MPVTVVSNDFSFKDTDYINAFANFFSLDVDELKQGMYKDIITSNNNIHELLASSLIQRFNKELNAPNKLPGVLIVQKLTDREKFILDRTFPNLRLIYRMTSVESHGFAHAHRICEYYTLLQTLGYFQSRAIILADNSVFVKSVGGNRFMYLKSGFAGIHSCEPILSVEDGARATEREIKIHHYIPNTDERAKIKTNYTNPGKYYCCNKSQDCDVAADYLIFVHSIYDMTLDDIGDAMASANAKIAHGTMIFSHKFFLKSKGYIPNLNVVYNINKTSHAFGKKKYKIAFNFLNDYQTSYVHDFDNLIKFIFTPVIYSSDRSKSYYKVIYRIDNGIAFFKLVLLNKSYIPATDIYIPFLNYLPNDHYLVSTYYLREGKNTKLCRSLIEVSKQTFDTTYAHLYSKSEGQFHINYAIDSLKSFANRVVVNGVTAVTSCDLSGEELVMLATAIYLKVYIDRYRNSKVIRAVLDDIETKRNNMGRHCFFSTICSALRRLFGIGFDNKSIDILSKFEYMLSNNDSYKYPINVESCIDIINLKTHFSSFTGVKTSIFSQLIPDEIVKFVLNDDDEDIEITASIHDDKSTELNIDNILSSITWGDQCDSNKPMYMDQVPGDGDCFFHAIRNIHPTAFGDLTNDQVRLEIFNVINSDNYYSGTCTDDITTPQSPVLVEVCFCIAHHFGFDLCIHIAVDGILKSASYSNFGYNKYHLYLGIPSDSKVGHFQPLFTVGPRPKFYVEYDVNSELTYMQDDSHDEIFDIDFSGHDTTEINRIAVTDPQVYGYDYKLANIFEIVHQFGLKVDTDYAMKMYITDELVLPHYIAFNNNFKKFHVVTAQDFDLPFITQIANYTQDTYAELLINYKGFRPDLCIADFTRSIRLAKFNEIAEKIISTVAFSTYFLEIGADFVINLNLPNTNQQWFIIDYLKKIFDRVYLYVPSFTPTVSTDFYVVCKNKLYNPTSEQIDAEYYNLIDNDVKFEFNEQTECVLDKLIDYTDLMLGIKKKIDTDYLYTTITNLSSDYYKNYYNDLLDKCTKLRGGAILPFKNAMNVGFTAFDVTLRTDLASYFYFTSNIFAFAQFVFNTYINDNRIIYEKKVKKFFSDMKDNFKKMTHAQLIKYYGVDNMDDKFLESFSCVQSANCPSCDALYESEIDGKFYTCGCKKIRTPLEILFEPRGYRFREIYIRTDAGYHLIRNKQIISKIAKVTDIQVFKKQNLTKIELGEVGVKSNGKTVENKLVSTALEDILVSNNIGTDIKSSTSGISLNHSTLEKSDFTINFVTNKLIVRQGYCAQILKEIPELDEQLDNVIKNNVDFPKFLYNKSTKYGHVITIVVGTDGFLSSLRMLMDTLGYLGGKFFCIQSVMFGVGHWKFDIQTILTLISERIQPNTSIEFYIPEKAMLDRALHVLNTKFRKVTLTTPGYSTQKKTLDNNNGVLQLNTIQPFEPGENVFSVELLNSLKSQKNEIDFHKFIYIGDDELKKSAVEYYEIIQKTINYVAIETSILAQLVQRCKPTQDLFTYLDNTNLDVRFRKNGIWYPSEPDDQYMYMYTIQNGFIKYDPNVVADILVTRSMCVFPELKLVNILRDVVANIADIRLGTKFSLVLGCPGAAKTTHILNNHKTSDLVLTTTRAGVKDILSRDRLIKNSKYDYLTAHSYLLNYRSKYDIVWFDEALMSHPGLCFYLAYFTTAKKFYMYGDLNQIPYHVRIQYEMKHNNYEKIFEIEEQLNTTYRCPIDVTNYLKKFYPDIETKSSVKNSLSATMVAGVDMVPEGFDYYLTFCQDEKQLLSKRFKNVLTVNEFQGQQKNSVCLFRGDAKNLPIYSNDKYIIVALTRHKVKFLYCTVISDKIFALIMGSQIGGYLQVKQLPTDNKTVTVLIVIRKNFSGFNLGLHRIKNNKFVFNVEYSKFITMKQLVLYIYESLNDLFDLNSVRFFFDAIIKSKKFNYMDLYYALNNKLGSIVVYDPENVHKMDRDTFVIAKQHCVDGILDDVVAVDEKYDTLVTGNIYLPLVYSTTLGKVNATSEFDVFQFEADGLFGDYVYFNKYSLTNRAKLKFKKKFFIASQLDSAVLQQFVNSINPLLPYTNKSDDVYKCHYSDKVYHLENCVIPIANFAEPYNNPNNVAPVLDTAMSMNRPYTLNELLLAVQKRNMASPKLSTLTNIDRTVDEDFDKFINKNFDGTVFDTIDLSHDALHDWLMTQNNDVVKMITGTNIRMVSSNRYNVTIKVNPKPVLDITSTITYAALQTIVATSKDFNSYYCPIFRIIKSRILKSLKKNIFFFSDMSLAEYIEKINTLVVDKNIFNHSLEIDIKKMDKSQVLYHLLFDCKVLGYFGMAPEFVSLWFYSHIYTLLYDMTSAFKCRVIAQRKSGDPSTWLLNTTTTLNLITKTTNVLSNHIILLSGDDSVIFSRDYVVFDDRKSSDWLNFEVKPLRFKFSYFCSKFLVFDGWKLYAIPDIFKLMIKLGRLDLANKEHVECYRLSLLDLMKDTLLPLHILILADFCISERYTSTVHTYEFIRDKLFEFLYNVGNFESLFVPNDNYNLQRGRLRDI